MKRSAKKGGKSRKKYECARSTSKKVLEKKPAKGGTPARDRSVRHKIFVKIFDKPKLEKEKRVRNEIFESCKHVVNKTKDVKLYISM